MSNKFAEVSPNPLSIIISQDNNDKKKLNLTIKNITNKYIIYKFLINTKGVLFAKPPTSFIKPFQSISIDVNILNNNLPLEEYIKTKLLIMVYQIDEEIKTIEQARKKYQEIKNTNEEKQEILVNLKISQNNAKKNNENDKNENENDENDKDDKNEGEKITYINYEQLKTELNNKNNEIKKNLEIQRQKLEKLVKQENKNNNYINNQGKRKKYYNLDNLILVFIILIGLIIGANFACGYNKIFKKK